jgi:hypothetical protein
MSRETQWQVMLPGMADLKVDTAQLMQLALSGTLKADSLVRENSTGAVFAARQIPGVFSDKQYMVALLLSIFLGFLGIDRFYTGHVGTGIAKLLTFGGCGIWALIDLILYAMNSVKDISGRPLS